MLSSRRRHGRLAALGLIAAMAVSVLPGARVSPALAVSPTIVISQVYGGGGNTTESYTHDYVELFNRGTTSAALTGWSIQYASALGTGTFGSSSTMITELPNVSLAPGQYYLVQELSFAAVGVPLPTADLVDATPISMSATGGKVVLVNTITPLACNGSTTPCSAGAVATIVDLVGYGAANYFEGTGGTPEPGNTMAALRVSGGCTDTDHNATDFVAGTPSPRNTVTPSSPCPAGDTAPSVIDTTPANAASNVALAANVSVTFSEPVNATGTWFDITCGTTAAHTATVSGGPTTFTLDPDSDFAAAESCTVTVFAAQVTDQDSDDPPNAMATNATTTFNTVDTPPDVTINQASGQTDPTATSPIHFTAVFLEPVTGFVGTDVGLSGTAAATTAVVTEIAPNDGTTYDVAVSGMTNDGTVIATVPAASAQDGGGNGNTASTSADNTVTFDVNEAPTFTVSGGQCSASNDASGTINLILFDADGDSLSLSLLSNSNPTLVPNGNVVLGGSGDNRTIRFTSGNKRTGTATLTFNLSDGTTTVSIVVTTRFGTDGNDSLTGTGGVDLLFCLNGMDVLSGAGGNDLLCGGNGTDAIDGGAGNDILDGQSGGDTLNGGINNDTLRGGTGEDTLTGGSGADLFSGAQGADTNTDFNAAEGDTSDGT